MVADKPIPAVASDFTEEIANTVQANYSEEPVVTTNREGVTTYVVKPGDTLGHIAEKFDINTSTLLWANDLSNSSVLQVGEELIILPYDGVRYTVQQGDTLGGIAYWFKADLEAIEKANAVDENNVIAVGEDLLIPNGTPRARGSSIGGPEGETVADSSPVSSGYYSHPLPGSVKTQGMHGHNAVDFGAAYGTPIKAAAAGTVTKVKNSGWNGGYGLQIVIEHENDTYTVYAHQSENVVSPGQWVERGEVIGYVGSTGRSTGNHLHFEVRGAANPFR